MNSAVTWYDVLGVLPDASQEDIRAAWQARREALTPGLLAGAAPAHRDSTLTVQLWHPPEPAR
jgi:hypothetical protein